MTVLRGVLAAGAGTLVAAVAGVLFELANAKLGWVNPKYGFMYFYPWLTALGGLLAGGLAAACFAVWNRTGKALAGAGAARAIAAALTGLLLAWVGGILFDYANGYFGWLKPDSVFAYGYTWLAALGGLLAGVVAVGSYASWQAGAQPAAAARGQSSTTRVQAKPQAVKPAAAPAGKGYTSARPNGGGFVDVPGMPLDDFQSALTPGDKDKE